MKLSKIILLVVLLIVTTLSASDFKEQNILFKQANNFVAQGNYNDAINLYKNLEKESNDSNLYYCIGHCYSQLKEKGWAILYYKKSLLIDSSNKLARVALEFEESNIIATNIHENSFLNRLLVNSYNYFSINKLAILILLLLIVLATIIYLSLSRKANFSIFAKRFYLTTNIFLIFLVVVVFAFKLHNYTRNVELVVINDNTPIFKQEEGRIFANNKKLQAGITLKYISDVNDEYIQVALPNGEKILIKKGSYGNVKNGKIDF